MKIAALGLEDDVVPGTEIFESAKDLVAVAGQGHPSEISGQRGCRQVPGGELQRLAVHAFEHDRRQSDAIDSEPPDQLTRPGWWRPDRGRRPMATVEQLPFEPGPGPSGAEIGARDVPDERQAYSEEEDLELG
jgi:hypothetical protein